MKKRIKYNKSVVSEKSGDEKLTRLEALKKAGKYAALTAAATFIILSPKESQAASTPQKPGW